MSNRKRFPIHKDQLSAIIFLVFGIFMLTVAIPVGIPVSFVPPGQISPRFLPEIIAMAITVVATLILLVPFLYRFLNRSVESGTRDKEAVEDDAKKQLDKENSSDNFLKWAPILSILIITAYFFLLLWAGFMVSSIFGMTATMLMFGERRWWLILITSTAIPVLVWLFATKLMHLPMP
jgi:hypothetical protein